ncbi:hypothetical protein E8E13_010527 [Curvularia kusanoi]|uniref:Uncharacterized protein n=1 Tax=Curvularia kusanoi TaxID=90978 RepID=A0A9P4W8E4_CURKU|nr:hypothetical protein E8E13_010527 [Curvularia kusanoi]
MSSTTTLNKTLSVRSASVYKARQSMLFRELELLLDLAPSTFKSSLLSLPASIRAHIISYLLPVTPATSPLPDLHTCLWGAEMIGGEAWRHDVVGYGARVPSALKLAPSLLLINRALCTEIQTAYWAASHLTLHAELRNTKFQNDLFDYSPHILRLPLLPHVRRVRLYVEWNYTLTKAASQKERIRDYVRMARDFVKAMEEVVGKMGSLEGMEISVLFFWKYRSGKVYHLSMADLFDVEDVLKKYAEPRWLGILRVAQERRDGGVGKGKVVEGTEGLGISGVKEVEGEVELESGAGVGYKLSSERKGLEQSGGMEIFVDKDLERCMGRKRKEVDFYGNFAVNEILPQPAFEVGKMI